MGLVVTSVVLAVSAAAGVVLLKRRAEVFSTASEPKQATAATQAPKNAGPAAVVTAPMTAGQGMGAGAIDAGTPADGSASARASTSSSASTSTSASTSAGAGASATQVVAPDGHGKHHPHGMKKPAAGNGYHLEDPFAK